MANKYRNGVLDGPLTGAVLPIPSNTGDEFLHITTGRNILMRYDGSNWVPEMSYSATTFYVDSSNGTDSQAKGFGTGTDAFATIAYAISQVPRVNPFNVTIILSSEDYTEGIDIGNKIQMLGDTIFEIRGTLPTAEDTGTATSSTSVANLGDAHGMRLAKLVDTAKSWGTGGTIDSGNTDGITTATYVLRDTGQNFTSTVKPGMLVHNTTDDTWSHVIKANSDTELILADDIMDDSEDYIICYGAYTNMLLVITGGTGSGQERIIDCNTDNTLYISGTWATAPDGTSTYAIYDLSTGTTIDLSGDSGSVNALVARNIDNLYLHNLNFENWSAADGILLNRSRGIDIHGCRILATRTITANYGILASDTTFRRIEAVIIEATSASTLNRAIRLTSCSVASEDNVPAPVIRSIKQQGGAHTLQFRNCSSGTDYTIEMICRDCTGKSLSMASFSIAQLQNSVVSGSQLAITCGYGNLIIRGIVDIYGGSSDALYLEEGGKMDIENCTAIHVNYMGGWAVNIHEFALLRGNLTTKLFPNNNTSGTWTRELLQTGTYVDRYTLTFVDGDLTAGVLTVSHNLGVTGPLSVTIIDNSNVQQAADSITFTDGYTTAVDLTSHGTLTGTWEINLTRG